MGKCVLKPIIKWAGGKGQLVDKISSRYPDGLGITITKFAEPFVGGGAILFNVLENYDLKDVYISDNNAELINMYSKVKTNVDDIVSLLQLYQEQYLPLDNDGRKEFYYKKRDKYNLLICNGESKVSIEAAALFIFLNRTCFNGLYRVNRKGLFNVPSGIYKNPLICDEQNLKLVSRALQNVTINCGDFRCSDDFIDEDTLVYFDPPYRPLNITSSFTSYTMNEFNDDDQVDLANYARHLSQKGAYVILSNSDPKNSNPEDDFFDELYKGFYIERVSAARMINSNAKARGEISELLIRNFTNQGEHRMRNFDEWLLGFRDSIADYKYYVDFGKVYVNVDAIKVELNILNSLIASQNIKQEFISLLKNYPETLKVMPILLAKREHEIYCQDEKGAYLYKFDLDESLPDSDELYERYAYFMEQTGLFDLLQHHIINNLVDYITGVETGLDSNGRKNRGGHLMEDLVENYIRKAGFKRAVTYFKEMYINEITEKWGIDLSAISNQGKMEKRFDFVVKTESMIYAIETNFYTSGGSKLNETSRSYKTLALEAKDIDGFTFVWFTDGKGWNSARHNLEETFDIMEHIYNISDIENGIIKKVFK